MTMKLGDLKLQNRCSADSQQQIINWLHAFAAAVRQRDFARGQSLFAKDVCAFGTRSRLMTNLTQLMNEQWRPVWNSTEGFDFDYDHMECEIRDELAWVAVTWSSRFSPPRNGHTDRLGRATYILHKIDGDWLAVHSHHSINP